MVTAMFLQFSISYTMHQIQQFTALIFSFVFIYLINEIYSFQPHYKDAFSGNEIAVLDEEWNLNRSKNVEIKLPLTIMNIYELFTKNLMINNYSAAITVVRCHFDRTNNSYLGHYTFDLSGYEKNQNVIIDAEMHLYM